MKLISCILVCVTYSHTNELPSNFKKCNRHSPHAAKCFLEAVQDGLLQATKAYPKINLPSFSPLEVSQLNIGAGSQQVVNVNQNYKNCKIYGIPQAKLREFRFDFESKFINGSGVVPELKFECDYQLDGRILLLPVVGSGSSTVVARNVEAAIYFDYEEVKKNGKTYIRIVSSKLSLDPKEISYHFGNLFNGDKRLGDNINAVLNENGREVFEDVRKGYEKGIGLILQQVVNQMFSKLSIEEAFE